jgi:hypothetical protein
MFVPAVLCTFFEIVAMYVVSNARGDDGVNVATVDELSIVTAPLTPAPLEVIVKLVALTDDVLIGVEKVAVIRPVAEMVPPSAGEWEITVGTHESLILKVDEAAALMAVPEASATVPGTVTV